MIDGEENNEYDKSKDIQDVYSWIVFYYGLHLTRGLYNNIPGDPESNALRTSNIKGDDP
jgi:hypothetical protein